MTDLFVGLVLEKVPFQEQGGGHVIKGDHVAVHHDAAHRQQPERQPELFYVLAARQRVHVDAVLGFK